MQKTLHQRNKSSPALSSLHAGGLKAAAKRTAFGDVSNTSNLSRPSKDDSAISMKGDYNALEKIGAFHQEKKPTALLRPAQRPLSVSAGLKSILSNVTNSHQASMRQPLLEVQEPAQPAPQHCANIRKMLTKRNTAVFKDLSHIEEKVIDVQKSVPSTNVVAVVHQNLGPREEPKIAGSVEDPQPKVRRTMSDQPTSLEPCDDKSNASKVLEVIELEPIEDSPAFRSDGGYIDDQGNVQLYQFDTHDPVKEPYDSAHEPVTLTQSKKEPDDAALNLDAQLEAQQPEPARKHRLTSASEPEEYWDEEEEEDNYDEDGYITTRSYKSRGENTTNGATIVLFPKMNQKIKRELAAAKELIEGARTNEDIDDESWDTTMVAEYGDEIFEYMKELEVSLAVVMENFTADDASRSRCCLTPTTWITKLRSNGRCDLFSWIGWYRCIIVSIYCQKLYSSVSITSIAFYLAKLFLLGSFSLWVLPQYSSPRNMRRSTVHRFKRSSTWLTVDIPWTKFSRQNVSCLVCCSLNWVGQVP